MENRSVYEKHLFYQRKRRHPIDHGESFWADTSTESLLSRHGCHRPPQYVRQTAGTSFDDIEIHSMSAVRKDLSFQSQTQQNSLSQDLCLPRVKSCVMRLASRSSLVASDEMVRDSWLDGKRNGMGASCAFQSLLK
jgi:hypothetical protein